MVFPGREQFRATLLRYVEVPGARLLLAVGFTPNAVTALGFCITVAAASLVGADYLLAGGAVFLAGSSLDLMDGAMARVSGRVTRFGALLDSLMDRLGEAALFLGMTIYAMRADLSDGRLLFFIVVLILALVTSQLVSYVNARGEGIGFSARVGLMTRPERVVLLALGLILGQRPLEIVLIVIAALSLVTLVQRVVHIQRALSVDALPAEGVDTPVDPL